MERERPNATDALERAREAVRRRAWADAHALFTVADQAAPLSLDDLEQLVPALHMVGRDDEALSVLMRAHQEAVRQGAVARAARHAFWLALMLGDRGQSAQASGWLRRGGSLLRDQPQTVERGYLLVPIGFQALQVGDFDAGLRTFGDVAEIADQFRDADLAAFARLGRGDALIGHGETREGMALLDEAMVAVMSGEVSAEVAGVVYCSVIEACQRLFDLRRAREWTGALTHWIDDQPQMAAYRGQCLLYRAELMTFSGSWPEAVDEARRAHDRLIGPPPDPRLGVAHYQEAELHRLRGAFDAAEAAYREASQHGRRPEPGLALLRLAQGRITAAVTAIERSLDDVQDPMHRPALLEARVEISLGAGDTPSARAAADELAGIADAIDAPLLRAMAANSEGAVRLAEGDARAALASLREAWAGWQALDAPYRAARTRVLVGTACRRIGDEDGAQLEFEAAREAFDGLGAVPDAKALARLSATGPAAPGGLSAREVGVLRLVAAGKTNRAIAHDLAISEKTVARHMSNILTKLDLPSRAAATAYAYRHDIVA